MVVIAAQNDTEEETLKDILFKLKKNILNQENNIEEPILLIVDIPGIVGYPWSINPNSLIILIQWLTENFSGCITILPSLPINYNSERVLENWGLGAFLKRENISILYPDKITAISSIIDNEIKTEKKDNSIPTFKSFKTVILYTQIGLLDENTLWSGSTLLYQLQLNFQSLFNKISVYPSEEITSNELLQAQWIWNWLLHFFPKKMNSKNYIQGNYPAKKKILTLFISSAFSIISKNSIIYDPTLIPLKPKMIFLSDSFSEIEHMTYHYFKKTLSKSFFYPIFREIFDQNLKKDLELLTDNNLSSFAVSDLIKENRLQKFHIHTYFGELSEEEGFFAYHIPDLLNDLLFDDFQNVNHIALLIGNKPPVPKQADWIIIFGENAIKSTLNAPFTLLDKNKLPKEPFKIIDFEIGGNQILDDDELEREILRKQRKIRNKIEKLETKINAFIDSISDKSIEEERNLLILTAKKKNAQKIQNLRTKIEKIRIDLLIKNEIRKIKLEKPNIIINQKIIRIPSVALSGLDFIPYLKQKWSKKEAPSFHFFYNKLIPFYQFSNPKNEWNKKIITQLKEVLKTTISEISTPLLPEIQRKLKKVKDQRNQEFKKFKIREKIAQQKIKNDYDPKILELKKKLKNLKKEEKKHRRKRFLMQLQRFSNYFLNKSILKKELVEDKEKISLKNPKDFQEDIKEENKSA
ncbi:MAG: hypothetical protein K9W44_04985 [Candidatus Lokiarchaeota archaeon]|nr:hypothetical protein [Candidatus Harpocratesius repetitus]